MTATTANGHGTKKKARIDDPDLGVPERTPGEFGRLVKELRNKRGISQAALARMAGISAGYVGLIETGDRGERPALDIVKRIANALGAQLEDTEQLLRVSGHLGEGESLVPTTGPQSFVDFIKNYRRFDSVQRQTLLALAKSWGLQETG